MAARLFLGAAAAGAISMYLLDPDHGRRRRAMMRDRLASGMSRLDDARSVASRDLRNRARGVAHEVRSRFTHEEVSDDILCERVRSRLGWAVSHPGAIEVSAQSGRVTLSGAVLEREYVRLLRTVWAVRGVADVEDRLAVHESAGGVSALQGSGRARGRRLGPWRENWPPGVRAIMGATGGALLINALAGRRGALGILGGVAGAALIARSSTNMPIDRLVGARSTPATEPQQGVEAPARAERVRDTAPAARH